MAGDWIKMEACTPEKAEVLAITATMGWEDCDMTVGKLFRMWRWFDQQTVDGNAPSVTKALLDRIVGVTGFCDAMASVDWLVINDGGISLPNFENHNGATAKSRAQGAKRAAKLRGSDKSNAATVTPTVTDALPREEKRREEVNQDQKPLSPPSADDEEAAKQIKFTTVSEIYNRVCGDVLPRCEALNPKRKTNIRNLCALKIRGGFPFRDSEFWEGYFNDCLTNPHWIGQNDRGWRADLEFLTRTEIALKVLEAA